MKINRFYIVVLIATFFVAIAAVAYSAFAEPPAGRPGDNPGAAGERRDAPQPATAEDIARDIDEFSLVIEEHAKQGFDVERVMQAIEQARQLLKEGKVDEAREILGKAHRMFDEMMQGGEKRERDGRGDRDRLDEKACGILEAASTLARVGEYGDAAMLAEKATRLLRDLEHRQKLENLPPDERERVMIKDRFDDLWRKMEKLAEKGVNVSKERKALEALKPKLESGKFDEVMPELDSIARDIERAFAEMREKEQAKEREGR